MLGSFPASFLTAVGVNKKEKEEETMKLQTANVTHGVCLMPKTPNEIRK